MPSLRKVHDSDSFHCRASSINLVAELCQYNSQAQEAQVFL